MAKLEQRLAAGVLELLTALVTGGSPRSTGTFYDVSYDRALSPPAHTTPYGIIGGPGLCPIVVGTQVGFDEEIDNDLTKLDAGGGINPAFLPRDPKNGCAPVYPHQFIRVNTLFEVAKAAGGYTAWSDKHPAYDLTNGCSGHGVDDLDDLYTPEINSIPMALPQVKNCNPLPDQTAVSSSNAWTDNFASIQCYDSLKVRAILKEIDRMNHECSCACSVSIPAVSSPCGRKGPKSCGEFRSSATKAVSSPTNCKRSSTRTPRGFSASPDCRCFAKSGA